MEIFKGVRLIMNDAFIGIWVCVEIKYLIKMQQFFIMHEQEILALFGGWKRRRKRKLVVYFCIIGIQWLCFKTHVSAP